MPEPHKYKYRRRLVRFLTENFFGAWLFWMIVIGLAFAFLYVFIPLIRSLVHHLAHLDD
jgi:uncharacterized membrane protein